MASFRELGLSEPLLEALYHRMLASPAAGIAFFEWAYTSNEQEMRFGICAALLGSQIPPRFIPSFSFWNDKGLAPYDLDKAKTVMKAVYARRDLRWTDADDRMVAQVLQTAPKVEKLGPINRVALDAESQQALGCALVRLRREGEASRFFERAGGSARDCR